MAAHGALLGIGTLHELEVLDPATKRVRRISAGGRWLGWDTQRRQFLLARTAPRQSSSTARLPTAVAKAHRRFHGAASRRALVVDVPRPQGRLRQLGLLKALVYRVPKQVRSPGKNPYAWHHAFGDTGHQGGDTYPERVMPAVCVDQQGNLFIRRRKGNIFRVDSWLRG